MNRSPHENRIPIIGAIGRKSSVDAEVPDPFNGLGAGCYFDQLNSGVNF
jgi:hypothetical protein